VASTDDQAYVSWSDSRNGTFTLPTEDAYFSAVVHDDKAATAHREPAVKGSSVLLGLAIGLVVAGLAVATVAGNNSRAGSRT
jgi:hypothetical protein